MICATNTEGVCFHFIQNEFLVLSRPNHKVIGHSNGNPMSQKKRNLSLARLWCEQQRIRVAFWEWKIVMVPWWKFGSWFVGNTRKYDGHTRIYTGQIFFISCSYDGKLALLLLDPCWTFAISLISCRTNVQRPALFTGLLLNNPVGYFVWPKLW